MARRFSGPQLRAARIAAGIQPERIALDVRRSAFTIHEYETGRVVPPTQIVAALADALGLTVDDFFEQVAV